jgi:hypothetical protein
MSAKVIGRITGSVDRARGPDVEMSISVPDRWIKNGETIEVELPRNLACAACKGGGCDVCERSGAVALRGRKDPVEAVEITLPKGELTETQGGRRAVLLRVPDHGGLPAEGVELPRGNLLLLVMPGESASKGVQRLSGPSIPPPPAPEVVSSRPVRTPPVAPPPLPGGPAPAAPPRMVIPILVALVVGVVLALLVARFIH